VQDKKKIILVHFNML